MSGPKTSQLEIERMIRAQLEALRSDVDHSRARARRRIAALLNELLNEAEGCAEAEEAAASLRQLAEAALAQLTAECAFTPATAMAESVARTERCSSRAVAIADAFEREAHPWPNASSEPAPKPQPRPKHATSPPCWPRPPKRAPQRPLWRPPALSWPMSIVCRRNHRPSKPRADQDPPLWRRLLQRGRPCRLSP